MSARNPRSLLSILAISFVLATMTSPNSTAAVAQNNDSSADSSSTDSDAKTSGDQGTRPRRALKTAAAADATAPAESSAKGADAAGDEGDDPDGRGKKNIIGVPRIRRRVASTPLMTVESFAKSSVVQGSAWPGIGPFQPSKDDNSLIDKANDSIKIEANQKKEITAVELLLAGKASTDFLGVEMATDFLLEALGTRPARIADFNFSLEKSKPAIFQKQRPASLTAGRYKISLKPVFNDESKTLTIRVESTTPVVETAEESPAPAGATRSPGRTIHDKLSGLSGIFKNIIPVPDDSPPAKTNTVVEAQPPGEGKGASTSANKNPSSPEALKATFKDLVQNWQKIKRNAVKNRDISQLSMVLSGNALRIQTGGIKWLASKHQFYEMVPRAVEIGTVTELVKDKKYAVVATVQESSKMYDDQTNQLLREAEDTYHVSYTVEKQGDKYVISDSSIIKLGQPTGQPPAPTPSKKP